MALEPAMAVAVGGVLGVAGGVFFFRSLRNFAEQMRAAPARPVFVVWGVGWRLTLVAIAFGLVGYAGGRPGALALLAGIILARIIVRRASGH